MGAVKRVITNIIFEKALLPIIPFIMKKVPLIRQYNF